MSISYKIFPMKFDTEAWQALMNTIEGGDVADFAYMFGMSVDSVRNWRAGHWHKDTPYPNMTNFVNICNWLDANPQDFFCLADNEANSDER